MSALDSYQPPTLEPLFGGGNEIANCIKCSITVSYIANLRLSFAAEINNKKHLDINICFVIF